MRIVVLPDLKVYVYVPPRASDGQILTAIGKKTRWIARKLDMMECYHPLPVSKQFISGETFKYLGRQYRLKVSNGKSNQIKLKGKYLCISCNAANNRAKVKKLVEGWYRTRAKEILTHYVSKALDTAYRHGIPKPIISIRKMTRRWGSCSSSGRITLNIKLLEAPLDCIEYVIMHELCHLKYQNHSKGFYTLLTRCQHDWRKRKETLDKMSVY
ncbi:MAG: hypothetical protein A2X45_10810 [Lentisphaerae bacterium GWF2_50_93]|nr:MAG: hypothetical protein A2X45_10810 [Lentisphaerae bacterium GWF2_50_93]